MQVCFVAGADQFRGFTTEEPTFRYANPRCGAVRLRTRTLSLRRSSETRVIKETAAKYAELSDGICVG
jgi:hypothetical protein